MIRRIVHWPDPVLMRVCDQVTKFNDDLKQLADDMLETMYFAEGRGLAAPQINTPLRLFVMDTTWKEGEKSPRILINPEILSASAEKTTGPEGCLSIPGVAANVERHAEVTMRWTGLDGANMQEDFTGFDAICAQHELDHLNGIVTLNRVPFDERTRLEAEYQP